MISMLYKTKLVMRVRDVITQLDSGFYFNNFSLFPLKDVYKNNKKTLNFDDRV